MTRRTLLVRAWLLMLGLVGISAFVNPTVARAQDDCKCDFATVFVDPSINCKFDICVKDASGFNCITVVPGGTYTVKCNKIAAFFLTDCKGNLVQINNPATKNCVQCVCLGPGCCVDACVGRDAKGCLVVKIGAASCKCP